MKTRRTFVAAGLGLFGVAALASVSAFADSMSHGHSKGPIKVESSFARASASAAVKSGAAYVTVTNTGDAPDRLIAVKGTAARSIQLHTHKMQDGAMVMTQIEGGVALATGETVTFKPGGNHIMMMGLTAPLVEGETVPLVLVFESAGEIAVDVPILGIGAMEHGSMNHSGHTE